MSGAILWYIHDHGRGHLERARAVLPLLRPPAIVAVGPRLADEARRVLDVPVVALPSDTDGAGGDADPPWPFHHAPTGLTLRRRAAALSAAVAEHDVTTAVVDVSVETVVWARLSGLRVVAVRQSGRRDDPGHALAWSSAHRVLVPQHVELEPVHRAEGDPSGWVFTGSFSRLDAAPRAPIEVEAGRRAVVLPGSGGSSFPCRRWRTEPVSPGWTAVIAGPVFQGAEGVIADGLIDDLVPALGSGEFAVASAGWGSVADAVSVGCPLVLVAEARPFDEQRVRATRLAEAGLAVVLDEWPGPGDLAELAELVRRRLGGRDGSRRRWLRYYDGQGAQRAAAAIERVHAA